MTTSIQDRIRQEIEGLHAFFVGWFRGTLPQSDFESAFLTRLSPDLTFIPPAGRLLGMGDLASLVRDRYASNPDFAIQIRRVTVQREFDQHILATYEEWQRNALASQPPDNGRIATVLFASSDPLRWMHIHETWLPEDVMTAGPYDF